jgi:sterol desaturase/sphingolipid hydroxylase (fatty acid hydroxylase superfamily)
VFSLPLQRFKINPDPWPRGIMVKEFFRSQCSLVMSAAVEMLLFALHEKGVIGYVAPCDASTEMVLSKAALLCPITVPTIFAAPQLARLFFILLWADFHFFSIHSTLHVSKWLYKRVHKVHHESKNTNPLSGLSFHPIEGFLYFTSIMVCLAVPQSLLEVRMLKLGLVVSPLFGHWGYAPTGPRLQPSHYLHHTKFDYNYGSGMFPRGFWMDMLFGTVYEGVENGRVPKAVKKRD